MNVNDLKFGCVKGDEDPRDHKLAKVSTDWTQLSTIDLRSQCPPVRNQGTLGACSSFGVTSLFDFVRRKKKLVNWLPSPLFTYYATRKAVNQEKLDNGAVIRDALKSSVRDGVAKETIWPYDVSKFTDEPPQEVWDNAEKHQTLEYLTLDDRDKNSYLGCLHDGYPFVFGIKLYSSFTSSLETVFGGYVRVPKRETEKLLGGHCMLAVGYLKKDDGSEFIIAQNSWDRGWGDKGFCYIPMEYFMSNDTFDFWTIRTTEVCDTDVPDEEPKPVPVPPTPEPVPEPTPVPVPEPEPTPTPEPTPVPPTPVPDTEPLFPFGSLSEVLKNPFTYITLSFIVFVLFFIFY